MRTSLVASALVAALTACVGDAHLTAPPAAAPDLGPALQIVIIDSTALPFAGTAADRAAGHYVFQIVGAVPTISQGDYVAGRQGGIFLGRVLTVSRDLDQLTLELAPAAWSEVLPSFTVHIPFTPGAGSAPTPYGEVRWGPWERQGQSGVTPQPPSSPGRRGSPMATDLGSIFDTALAFLLGSTDLCAASGLVSGCINVTAKIIGGNLSFNGGIDLDFQPDFSTFPPTLVAKAHVRQQLDAGIDFQLTGNGSVAVDIPIPEAGIVRKFSARGLKGEIELGVIVSVEGSIEGTTIEPHLRFVDTATADAGISSATGFFASADPHVHFDAGAKVVDLGDLGVKLSLGPEVHVKLDVFQGKAELGAKIDQFGKVTENVVGALQIGNWHVHAAVGKEASLSGALNVPFFGIQLSGELGIQFDTLSLVDLWGTGDLDVVATTTGTDIWPGQTYHTSVARTVPADRPPWFRVLSATLGVATGVNNSDILRGGFLCHQFFPGAPLIVPFIQDPQDCDLVATSHNLSPLTGIAWNCTVTSPLPSPIGIKPRFPFDFTVRLTTASASVFCRSAYAIVRDTVAAMLATGRINVGGIATAFDAKLFAAEAARNAGDPAGADSALVDLMNQLQAQFGKHITTGAATELLAFDALLRACYETIVPTCSMLTTSTTVALGARSP